MKTIVISLSLVLATITGGHCQSQTSQTLDNLQKAYQAEANATRRYGMFAQKAEEENYDQVAKLFRAVSKSESIHMQNHKRVIENLGGTPEEIVYEDVDVKTTKENLVEPIEGEKQETEALYPSFVKTAKKEKLKDAAKSFTYAMQAEAQHEKLFKDALKNLGNNKEKTYYVSNISGATMALDPDKPSPNPKYSKGIYLKID